MESLKFIINFSEFWYFFSTNRTNFICIKPILHTWTASSNMSTRRNNAISFFLKTNYAHIFIINMNCVLYFNDIQITNGAHFFHIQRFFSAFFTHSLMSTVESKTISFIFLTFQAQLIITIIFIQKFIKMNWFINSRLVICLTNEVSITREEIYKTK